MITSVRVDKITSNHSAAVGLTEKIKIKKIHDFNLGSHFAHRPPVRPLLAFRGTFRAARHNSTFLAPRVFF